MSQPRVYFSWEESNSESELEKKVLVSEVCENLGLTPIFKAKAIPEMELENLYPYEKNRISKMFFLYDLVDLYDSDILIADLNPKVQVEPAIEIILDISHAWHQKIPVIGYASHVKTYQELNLENKNSQYIEPFDYPVNPRLAEQCTEILHGNVLKAILRANAILNYEES